MGWLSARDVLWYLTFCGFAINYMLRININIAIVGMARGRARHHTGEQSLAGQCGLGALPPSYTASTGPLLFTTQSVNRTELYAHNNTDPLLFTTPSVNRTELYDPSNTDVGGTDSQTKYSVQFTISSPTTPKSVVVNASQLTSVVELTYSADGTKFSVVNTTKVISRTVPFKTLEDYSTHASAQDASGWAFATEKANDTGAADAELSYIAKGDSVGDVTTPSPLKPSISRDSSGVPDRESVEKTTVLKKLSTLSTVPQKQVSSSVPTTTSVTGQQLTRTDSSQVPPLTGAGSASTTPAPLLPTALPLTAKDKEEEEEEDGRYDWDEYQQGLVLGAFFWLHWSTQIPGGMLSQRVGPKLVFGVSNLVACLLAVLLPLAASIDYRALIAVRVLQGFVAGAAWPSMHSMTANWIPPNDRSKFVTAYLGSSVGAALTFPLCGFLMEWFGWPTVFYTTALLGSAWFLSWWFLVFDHPHIHPRISRTELDYLKSNLGSRVIKRKPPTPWREIVTSLPLWMNVLAQWGGIWGLFTMLTQAPTYFRHVHGWSIRATGLLSGFPHICRITFAMMVSWVGDYMLKKDIVSRTNLRKIATALCTVVQGVLVLGLAYSGCSPALAAVCLAAAVGASGAVSTGPLASLVDISPNYASILLGITNMLTVAPGFISPIIVGLFTYQNQTVDAWRAVFLITAAMLVVPGVVYTFCASSELQPWNSPASGDPREVEAATEKVPLKADSDVVGDLPAKLYLQDDGNLLTKRNFEEDGSVPMLSKQDIKEDGNVPNESEFQKNGSVLTALDGEKDDSKQDVNKARSTATTPETETVASFPIVPDVDTAEGMPKKLDVDKDGNVRIKSDVEDVPIKPEVEGDGSISTNQQSENDRGEPTKANVTEDVSSPAKFDVKENDSETQQKTDVEMGDARNPDGSDKAAQ